MGVTIVGLSDFIHVRRWGGGPGDCKKCKLLEGRMEVSLWSREGKSGSRSD